MPREHAARVRRARRPNARAVRHLAPLTGIALLVAVGTFAATAPPRRVLPRDLPLTSAGPDSFLARFETTQGSVTVRACRAWAPLGVDRLYHLVHGRYYDGLTIYRVGT